MAPGKATMSPPKSKKAEAAAVRGQAFVWSSCCLITCFLFAAGLCCCAPPALAGDSLPWPLNHVTSLWKTKAQMGHKDDKQGFEEIEALYPGARAELLSTKIPFAQLTYYDLSFSRSLEWDGKVPQRLFAYFFNNPHGDLYYKHRKNMLNIRKIFLECYDVEKAGIEDITSFTQRASKLITRGDADTAAFWRMPNVDEISKLTANVRLDSDTNITKRDGHPGLFWYTPNADEISKLAVDVQQDSYKNIHLRLWLPKMTPIGDRMLYSGKALYWDYSASFKCVSNQLIPTTESLILEEIGDRSRDGTVRDWRLNQKIEQTFDDTGLELQNYEYNWNLKCSNKWNQPGYEYTWITKVKSEVSDEVLNQYFVGKAPIFPNSSTTSDKPKCCWLILTSEKEGARFWKRSESIEKALELPNGSKIHEYYMEKEHNKIAKTTWSGAAISNPSNALINFYETPLDYNYHFGMSEIKSLVPKTPFCVDSIRYASIKTPSDWFVSAYFTTPMLTYSKNFSWDYKSQRCTKDRKSSAASSGAIAAPLNENPAPFLNEILTCPIERGRVVWRKQDEVDYEQLGNPCDCRSSTTNHNYMVFNNTFLFFTLLFLFVSAKLFKSSPKVRTKCYKTETAN